MLCEIAALDATAGVTVAGVAVAAAVAAAAAIAVTACIKKTTCFVRDHQVDTVIPIYQKVKIKQKAQRMR